MMWQPQQREKRLELSSGHAMGDSVAMTPQQVVMVEEQA